MKEEGKRAGKRQPARHPNNICTNFRVFPEEELNFIVLITELFIIDKIESLQFILTLAKMKHQLEHRSKSGLTES